MKKEAEDVWEKTINQNNEMRMPIYFPVVGGGPVTTMKKYTVEQCIEKFPGAYKKSYRYWNENEDNYFDYPFYFMSAFYGSKYSLKNDFKVDKDNVFIMTDSGGYQLVTGVANPNKWNQKKCLDWAEKNATVTPILDCPAQTSKGLEYAINYSVESAKYCVENRTGECKILNVISGNRYGILSKWWEHLSPFHENMDGVAHGGANDICSIMEAILILINNGTYHSGMKPAQHHIFGVSYGNVMIYAAYIQRLLNEMDIPVTITYDSSVASISIANGRWISRIDSVPPKSNGQENPNSLCQNESLSTRAWAISKNNEDMKDRFNKYKHFGLGCSCPVCKGIDDISLLVGDDAPDIFYMLGFLNNVFKQLEFKDSINHMIMLGNYDVWSENIPGEIIRTMKVIEKAFSNPKSVEELYPMMSKLGFKRGNMKPNSSNRLDNFF